MSKAEKFIHGHTMNGSNQIINGNYGTIIPHFNPWLTPDQARKAVEIAREEMREETIKIACDAYCKICGHYAHKTPTYICRQACNYYKDFKQAMKDE